MSDRRGERRSSRRNNRRDRPDRPARVFVLLAHDLYTDGHSSHRQSGIVTAGANNSELGALNT
jgi:hypothetical protein